MSFTDEYLSWGSLFLKRFPELILVDLECKFYMQLRARGDSHELASQTVDLLLKVQAKEENTKDIQDFRSGLLSVFQRLSDIVATAKDGMAEASFLLDEDEK